MHSTKRPLTEYARNADASLDCGRDGISSDLTARLRNVGARVRKHVTEGYATTWNTHSAPPTPYNSPTKGLVDSSCENVIFRSAIDTLHDVYSSASPTKSKRKRGRDADSDTELDMTRDSPYGVDVEDTEVQRQIKPLRRARRPFLVTRSLPVGASRFLGESENNGGDSSTSPEMDEDWSIAMLEGTSPCLAVIPEGAVIPDSL